jgi:biopolymer transport protein TolR
MLNLAAVKAKQSAHPDQPVVIAADRSVRYESVLRVMDLLQRENVARVGLLAQPLPATPAAGARP